MFMCRMPGHGCAPIISERKASRGRIAVQDAAFPTLLVIDDELHRDARTPRPMGIGRRAAVADEIAGVELCHNGQNSAPCAAHPTTRVRQAILPGLRFPPRAVDVREPGAAGTRYPLSFRVPD